MDHTSAALGIICGFPAGVIMSLPARVLEPQTHSIGMGVFYTVYFFSMMVGTGLGGSYAAFVGSAGAAFDFGAAMLLTCPVILWLFHRYAQAVPRVVGSSA